jgi:microcystin-dependent protein
MEKGKDAMSEPFLSEIRIMSFGFAPNGWALCDGQQLPVNQNQALFALLETTYGGDGETTFALPDLQGRTPIHRGGGYPQGQRGGEQSHILTVSELPSHTHVLNASGGAGAQRGGANAVLANAGSDLYVQPQGLTQMSPGAVGTTGGGQPYENMQPYLTLTFCIALKGTFPPRS